jgi:hypothetical protein
MTQRRSGPVMRRRAGGRRRPRYPHPDVTGSSVTARTTRLSRGRQASPSGAEGDVGHLGGCRKPLVRPSVGERGIARAGGDAYDANRRQVRRDGDRVDLRRLLCLSPRAVRHRAQPSYDFSFLIVLRSMFVPCGADQLRPPDVEGGKNFLRDTKCSASPPSVAALGAAAGHQHGRSSHGARRELLRAPEAGEPEAAAGPRG